ncbi:hypothetical protein FQN50_001986 [Emmonsiellopsis sp. PD_5]|nr:hypothetical protein FQN50_001986 [Emmonsiellopsis sp. PD_5]
MRASTYSILAAFFSLGAVDALDAPARPQYYFPKDVKRDYAPAPAEKRAPQNGLGTTIVVVPVTVYVGPDGIPRTLGGGTITKTTTSGDPSYTASSASSTGNGGLLSIGLPNLLVPPSSTVTGSEGISFSYGPGGPTGTGTTYSAPSSSPTSSPSSSETSSSAKNWFSDLFPTLSLPGLPSKTESGTAGTGSATTATTKEPLFTFPPLFPKPTSTTAGNYSTNETSSTRSDVTDLFPSLVLPTLSLPTLGLPTLSLPSLTMPSLTAPPYNQTGGLPLPTSFPVSEPTGHPTYNGTNGPLPPTSIPSGIFPNPTDIPSGIFPTSGYPTGVFPTHSEYPTSVHPTSTSASHNSTRTSAPPTTTRESYPTPTPEPTTKKPLPPISTDTETKISIPTSIVYQPTPPAPNPTVTNKPSSLPRIISPDSGIPKTPANSILVQFGFNASLSYELVVSNRDSILQIFGYTPQGVGYTLKVADSKVVMQSIQPYDTLETLHYTTALALFYIPENQVDKLSEALHNPFSRLYSNPDFSVARLMSFIDPSIPLVPGGYPIGQETGPGGKPTGPAGDGDEGESPGSDGDGAGGSGGSSNVKATSVGIGLGVVGGAALYGAAMFFVARRYRRKRKLHRRTSSLTSGMGDMPESGPTASDALMSGGRPDGYTSPTPYNANGGRTSQNSGGAGSARTQMISAPVMAENSLGWN